MLQLHFVSTLKCPLIFFALGEILNHSALLLTKKWMFEADDSPTMLIWNLESRGQTQLGVLKYGIMECWKSRFRFRKRKKMEQ